MSFDQLCCCLLEELLWFHFLPLTANTNLQLICSWYPFNSCNWVIYKPEFSSFLEADRWDRIGIFAWHCKCKRKQDGHRWWDRLTPPHSRIASRLLKGGTSSGGSRASSRGLQRWQANLTGTGSMSSTGTWRTSASTTTSPMWGLDNFQEPSPCSVVLVHLVSSEFLFYVPLFPILCECILILLCNLCCACGDIEVPKNYITRAAVAILRSWLWEVSCTRLMSPYFGWGNTGPRDEVHYGVVVPN